MSMFDHDVTQDRGRAVEQITASQANSVVGVISAIGDAIDELGAVPSGVLYAQLCGKLTLETYQQVIEVLEMAKRITVKSHMIRSTKVNPHYDHMRPF